jgi:hypothetical protein
MFRWPKIIMFLIGSKCIWKTIIIFIIGFKLAYGQNHHFPLWLLEKCLHLLSFTISYLYFDSQLFTNLLHGFLKCVFSCIYTHYFCINCFPSLLCIWSKLISFLIGLMCRWAKIIIYREIIIVRIGLMRRWQKNNIFLNVLMCIWPQIIIFLNGLVCI